MSYQKRCMIIAVLWAVIFTLFIGVQALTLGTGTEVLLKTVPLDPRDIFRGDYVVLRYDINQVPVDADVSYESIGRTIYVQLEQENGYGKVVDTSFTKPAGGLFLRGEIIDVNNASARVTYEAIESYFVPEGRGYELEELRGTLDVKVKINKNGGAVIEDVLYEGKPYEFSVQPEPASLE